MSSNTAVMKIGHYRLGATLGHGSFGKVKLAEHEMTGHKVAVKILNREKIKNMGMDEKIKREIHVFKLFRHRHIIRLYQVIDTPTDIFMIMEYVAGGELFDYIVRTGRMPEDMARRVFQQIISGVEYCHNHMVVHRDLKPENLLLDVDHNVKIADFGLSNLMKDGEFMRTSCGSPNYAAPEVISGKLYAGPEVDIWSCGVILYALVCGRLPFDDESIPALFKKIKSGTYVLPDSLPAGPRELIPRMLVVDPMRRISIKEIREHWWFQQNLPAYLRDEALPREPQIDEAVLDEVMGLFSRDPRPPTRDAIIDDVKNSRVNHVTAAYNLILDNRRDHTTGASSTTAIPAPPQSTSDWDGSATSPVFGTPGAHIGSLLAEHFSSSPAPSSLFNNASTLSSSVAAASPYKLTAPAKQDDASSSSFARRALALSTPAAQQQQQQQPSRRWYLGVHSRRQPHQIMKELFRALQAMHFEWKMVTPFALRCRREISGNAAEPAFIKIGATLFKVNEKRYLLDFHKVEGDMFMFFDLCGKLIHALRL